MSPDQLPTLAALQMQSNIDWSPVTAAEGVLAARGRAFAPAARATGGLQGADGKYFFFSSAVSDTGDTTSWGGIGIKIANDGSADVYVEMFQQPAAGTGSFTIWYTESSSVMQCALTPDDIADGALAYTSGHFAPGAAGTTPFTAHIAKMSPQDYCADCGSVIGAAQSAGIGYGASLICAALGAEGVLPGLVCGWLIGGYISAAANTLKAWAHVDASLVCTPNLRALGVVDSSFVCPPNNGCSIPPLASGQSIDCYECQVACACASDLGNSILSSLLCTAMPIKAPSTCGAIVGAAVNIALQTSPTLSCDQYCQQNCARGDGGTPDGSNGTSSTCPAGGAADVENPVGGHLFEFVGDDHASISGGGGYQTHYDLLVGADLQSNMVGLESYTVRSAALKVDVSYTSTPACTDSKTGQLVTCSSQLAECITATFATDDFDLTAAMLIHEAPGSASNPIPDDFYEIKFALGGGKVFTSARGATLQYASGEELLLGTASDSGYAEAGYFHSQLTLPAPYVQFGLSPGEVITGQASIKGRDGGAGP